MVVRASFGSKTHQRPTPSVHPSKARTPLTTRVVRALCCARPEFFRQWRNNVEFRQ